MCSGNEGLGPEGSGPVHGVGIREFGCRGRAEHGRGSECSDLWETCWGTEGRKTPIRMIASQVIG